MSIEDDEKNKRNELKKKIHTQDRILHVLLRLEARLAKLVD